MPTATAEHAIPDSDAQSADSTEQARAQAAEDSKAQLRDDLNQILISKGVPVRGADARSTSDEHVITTTASERSQAPEVSAEESRQETLRDRLRSMTSRTTTEEAPDDIQKDTSAPESAQERWHRVFTQTDPSQSSSESGAPTSEQREQPQETPSGLEPAMQTVYARPRESSSTEVAVPTRTPDVRREPERDFIDVEGEEVDAQKPTPPVDESTPGPNPEESSDKKPEKTLTPEELAELVKRDMTGDVLDVSRSTRAAAEHKAGIALRESKAEIDRERQAFMEAHPKLADKVAGRILLNIISTAKHPVETIWRQNIFREYYRQKEVHKFLSGEKADRIALGEDAQAATFSRFEAAENARAAGDTATESVYKHQQETLHETDSPEVIAFKGELTQLFKEYSTGDMSLEEFQEQKGRLIAEQTGLVKTRQVDGERIADTIDNLTNIAVDLRTIFEHTQSLELIDEKLANFQLITGEALVGPRAEVRKTSIDRIIEKTSQSKAGSLLNEQTVALAVAGVYALATKGATSAAARAMGTIGLGSLASGAVAFFREKGAMRQEQSEVERELATGFQPENADLEYSPIRERLTETLAGMTSAQDMMDGFQARMDKLPEPNAEGKIDMSPEDASQLLDLIAEARARTLLGDTLGRDLIRYSSSASMESERLALDTNIINMTAFLKEHYSVEHPDHLPEAFESFDALLDSKVKLIIEGDVNGETKGLKAEIAAGDKDFKSFSTSRALKRAATTAGIGAITGLLVREVAEFGASKMGLGGQEAVKVAQPMKNQKLEGFGTAYEYPKDWKLSYETGTITNAKSGAVIADHLTFKEHGGFSDASVEALRAKGYNIELQHAVVDGPPVETKVGVDVFAKTQNKVQRFWQDNNTTKFDKNELHEYIYKDGNDIVVDARTMSPRGSFHGGRYVDAQSRFADGQGRLLASLDRDHQSTPLQMEIGKDGTVRIPADSDVARNLFKVEGNTVTSKSAFLEVATNRGMNANGAQQLDILSTVKGDGISELTSVSNPEPVTLTRTIMTVMGEKTETQPGGVDFPFLFLPWSSRFGLENFAPADAAAGATAVRQEREDGNDAEPGQATPGTPSTSTGVGSSVVVFHDPPADPTLDNGPEQVRTAIGVGSNSSSQREIGMGNDVVEPTGQTSIDGSGRIDQNGGEQRGDGIRELNPVRSPEQTSQNPERSEAAERVARIHHSGDVARVTEQLLKDVGLDVDEIIDGGLEGLQLRLRSYDYSRGDIVTTRALLDRAEAMFTDTPTRDRTVARESLARVRSYLDKMDQEYDPERLTRLNLIYTAKDMYQKIHSIRHALPVDMGSREIVQRRFNRALDKVRSGGELAPATYRWMSDLLAQSADLSAWVLNTKRTEALEREPNPGKQKQINKMYDRRIRRSADQIEAQTTALGRIGIEITQARAAARQEARAPQAEARVEEATGEPIQPTDDSSSQSPQTTTVTPEEAAQETPLEEVVQTSNESEPETLETPEIPPAA